MEEFSVSTIVATAGFVAGIFLGVIVSRTNFCTMGSLSDIIFLEDYRRFRAWLLAMTVALIGTQSFQMAGVVDIYSSIYLGANLGWAGAIVGGLMFGFGMTMAGGCANKNLIRIGGGNLKSLIVILVMGVFAYMTLRGLTGLARVQLERATMVDLSGMGLKSQGLVDIIAAAIGSEAEAIRMAVTVVVALTLLFVIFKDKDFRNSPVNIIGGIGVGLIVPAGWWITGVLGADEFDPTQLASFSFVAPSGQSLQYLMTFTGTTINFGVATLGGVIVGAFLVAVMTKSFSIETFTEKNDMIRHLIGAALMGVGGIMALGCTIGQGVTGISTLALGSVIALLSILLGGVIGLKYLEEGTLGGAVKAVFSRA